MAFWNKDISLDWSFVDQWLYDGCALCAEMVTILLNFCIYFLMAIFYLFEGLP